MKDLMKTIFYFIFRPPGWLVLTLFTAVFFLLIYREVMGLGAYPDAYTPVYIAVLIGTSLSNLLKKSRWMR